MSMLTVNTFTLYGDLVDQTLKQATKTEVEDAYKARGVEYVPLGVHGTLIAVDWNSCYAVGACIVQHKCFNGIEQNKMFQR